MKKFCLYLIVLATFACAAAGPDEPRLFPERQREAQLARAFFAELYLEAPSLRQVRANVDLGNYASAFLNLSESLGRDPFFPPLLELYGRQEVRRVERLAAAGRGLAGESWRRAVTSAESDALHLHLLLLHAVFDGYRRNTLSAPQAADLWRFLLELTRRCENDPRSPGEAAALALTARMEFFRQAVKWGRVSRRFFQRHPVTDHDNPWLQRVVAGNL